MLRFLVRAFVIGALGFNFILAIGAFFWFPSEFAIGKGHFCYTAAVAHFRDGAPYNVAFHPGCEIETCYIVAFIGAGAAVSTLIIFAIHKLRSGPTLLALIGHAFALILLFAGIYLGFGLMVDHSPVDLSKSTALYFSVVTWTTLGYGDFTPKPEIYLVAALEALLGYMIFFFWFSRRVDG